MSDKAFSLRMSSELHTLSNIVAKHLNVSKNEVICGLLEEWTIKKVHEIIQKPYSGNVDDLEDALSGLLQLRQKEREEEIKLDEFIGTFRHSLNRIKEEKQNEIKNRDTLIENALSEYQKYLKTEYAVPEMKSLAIKLKQALSENSIQELHQLWMEKLFDGRDIEYAGTQVSGKICEILYKTNKQAYDDIGNDEFRIQNQYRIPSPTCICILWIIYGKKPEQVDQVSGTI